MKAMNYLRFVVCHLYPFVRYKQYTKLIFCSLFILFSPTLLGAGIVFFEGSFDEAQQAARSAQKHLFVTLSPKQCNKCTNIESLFSTDGALSEYHNRHFISFRLYIETPEGKHFAGKYGIKGIPDLFYFSPSGTLDARQTGTINAWQLMNQAYSVVNAALPQLDAERCGSGRLPSILPKAVAVQTYPSPSILTPALAWQQANKAISLRDETMLEKGICSLPDMPESERQSTAMQVKKWYYLEVGDWKNYMQTKRRQATLDRQQNTPLFWHQCAQTHLEQSHAKPSLQKALECVERSLSLDYQQYHSHATRAFILYKLGKRRDALQEARTAIELAKQKGQSYVGAYNLLAVIEKK